MGEPGAGPGPGPGPGGGGDAPGGALAGGGAPGDLGALPDELLRVVLGRAARGAGAPGALLGAERACRFLRAALRAPEVLRELPAAGVAVPARAFAAGGGERFLERAAAAGNPHAQYLLGMARFYCQGRYAEGQQLLGAATKEGHTEALFALAVIKFNGSSGKRADKCLRSGVLLCIEACERGHQRALQELGLCMSRGYGLPRDREVGKEMLMLANKNEADFAERNGRRRAPPPGNAFLSQWWQTHAPPERRRLCSHPGCGRLETRKHEFRRCDVCNAAFYCSFSCQTIHWKSGHKDECVGDASSAEEDEDLGPGDAQPIGALALPAVLQQAAGSLLSSQGGAGSSGGGGGGAGGGEKGGGAAGGGGGFEGAAGGPHFSLFILFYKEPLHYRSRSKW